MTRVHFQASFQLDGQGSGSQVHLRAYRRDHKTGVPMLHREGTRAAAQMSHADDMLQCTQLDRKKSLRLGGTEQVRVQRRNRTIHHADCHN